MSLSLKIITFKGQPFDAGKEIVFDCHGGTIGRADENTLSLPDPEKFVSRRHAAISFENGQYLIKDSSLSGTYIDDQEPPLNNAAQTLVDSMRLRIGEYEILVSITPEQQPDDFAFGTDPFAVAPAAENPTYEPGSCVSADDIFSISSQDDPHLESFLCDTGVTPLQGHDDSLMQANISILHDSFIPPASIAASQSSNEIPDDFNFEDLFNIGADAHADEHSRFQEGESKAAEELPSVMEATESAHENAINQLLEPDMTESIAPVQAITTSIQDEPPIPLKAKSVDQAAASNELFNVFLQGASIENKELQTQAAPETMHRIGLMFRKLVEGTAAVLRSRAEFKSQFRVSMTTIKTSNNNPLKFSVTTEDALMHLVKNGQGVFKDSVEAIDESFDDIMSHQMAMQAGIQASLTQILKLFDPKMIEKQFEEGLVLQKKSKCWDKYSALYPHVVEEAMADFFGDAFAEAYDKQMKQLYKLRKDK